MIIIAGYTRADPADRDANVAARAPMVERARQQDGCLDFSISADPVEADRVNLFECWRDQSALDAWRRIAKGPRIALREVQVNLYRCDRAETPFPARTRNSSRKGGKR